MISVRPTRPDHWSVATQLVGNEELPLVIIDNALANPDAHFEDARRQSFKPLAPNYPGIRAAASHSYLSEMMPGLLEILRDTFGYTHGAEVAECFYSLLTTRPEQLKPMQRLPHFDGVGDGKVALLHYLSRRDGGGTHFYRHRSTGYESVPEARFQDYKAAVKADAERFGVPEPAYPEGDSDMFERIGSVEARYNRAVLYRGTSIHAVGVPPQFGFSDSVERGRLTVNTFLKPAEPNG